MAVVFVSPADMAIDGDSMAVAFVSEAHDELIVGEEVADHFVVLIDCRE